MAKLSQKSVVPLRTESTDSYSTKLMDKIKDERSREFVFAVVGYAGSGTSKVSMQLRTILNVIGKDPIIIKAREGLEEYASKIERDVPSKIKSKIKQITAYQDLGDALRKDLEENSAVAAYMIRRVKEIREGEEGRKIFILDSIKHPGEVGLLRHIYGDSFCLIGVGCRPDVRKTRLKRKFNIDQSSNLEELEEFINRDNEDSEHVYGQHVSDTFHLSDYFVDNTPNDEDEKLFMLPDKLKRLIDLLFVGEINRPEDDEIGLYHAHAASLQSSCLSRQVGASILDAGGNLLSVGTNDVPRSGGGLYCNHDDNDDRCFKKRKECSNTVKQLDIVKDLFERLVANNIVPAETKEKDFEIAINGSRIGSLLEFSRSVHAEMDSLLTLVREGVQLNAGATLYSTTYPCHNCARHIVAAGIYRVVYLEPYAKSMAIDLHDDSIADNLSKDKSKGKVVFEPYQGVSFRLYNNIFRKSTDLKDKSTGALLSPDEIDHHKSSLLIKSYIELEDDVVRFINRFESGEIDEEQD